MVRVLRRLWWWFNNRGLFLVETVSTRVLYALEKPTTADGAEEEADATPLEAAGLALLYLANGSSSSSASSDYNDVSENLC